MKFNKEQKKRMKSFNDELNGLLNKYRMEMFAEVYVDTDEETGEDTIDADVLFVPEESYQDYLTEKLDANKRNDVAMS